MATISLISIYLIGETRHIELAAVPG